MSTCPECSSRMRKCKDGFICQNNHKFLPGSKVYNELTKESKLNKKLCPLCQTPEISRCMCPISERTCINDHIWTPKYYQGDKRYFCENPPERGHAFNFS